MGKLSASQKILAVSGLVLAGASGAAGVANSLRNIEGDGIDPTRSAIAYVLGIDVQDQCHKEFFNCTSGRLLSEDEGGIIGACPGWVCDERLVADLSVSDLRHRGFHKPDTVREKVAAVISNPVSGIGGIVAAAVAIAIRRKKKQEQ